MSREILTERLCEAVTALQHATSDNMALRRKWEAAQEERDALQIQMNNMEKEMLLAQPAADPLDFQGQGLPGDLSAMATMRASMFYEVMRGRPLNSTESFLHRLHSKRSSTTRA